MASVSLIIEQRLHAYDDQGYIYTTIKLH